MGSIQQIFNRILYSDIGKGETSLLKSTEIERD